MYEENKKKLEELNKRFAELQIDYSVDQDKQKIDNCLHFMDREIRE